MSTLTKFLKLFKPEYTDAPDIVKAVSNNMDLIDTAINGKQADLGVKTIGDNLSLDSNGVLDAKVQKTTVDTELSATSDNPIANKAVDAVADQIQKNTAQIETAGKATSSHAVGEYVLIDNVLYKVTTAVAANDAWTINGNIQTVNLGSEIAALNNNLTKGFQADVNDPGGYIGMKVEGGGTIFFDYKIGFRGSDVNVAPLTDNFKTYHVDPIRNMVICDNPTDTSKRDRFYVVSDYDNGEYKHGTNLMWSNGTSGSLYKSVGTATGFGTGKSNTEKCIAAANTDGLLGWNNNAYNCIWHYVWKGDWQRTTDRGTNQWFVPSKDELALLCDMQYASKARTSYDQKTALRLLPIAFYSYYWSSSESSATVAFTSNFYIGNAADTPNKNNTDCNRVRLVRTY